MFTFPEASFWPGKGPKPLSPPASCGLSNRTKFTLLYNSLHDAICITWSEQYSLIKINGEDWFKMSQIQNLYFVQPVHFSGWCQISSRYGKLLRNNARYWQLFHFQFWLETAPKWSAPRCSIWCNQLIFFPREWGLVTNKSTTLINFLQNIGRQFRYEEIQHFID